VVQTVKTGEPFTEKNVRSIRPGYGLPPKYWEQVLGSRASCDLAQGTPLEWKLISP
jgi:pseudaminic acid synthase